MSGIDLQVTGVDDVLSRFAQFGEKVIPAAANGLYQEAELIMTDSKRNYVPVDHGVLRASGHVLPPVIEGNEISVHLTYGGAAKAYAVAIHEHLSAYSPWSWRRAESKGRPVKFSPSGRGPKYLELPFLAAARGLIARLGARMREALFHG